MYGQLMARGKQFVHCREVVLLLGYPLSEVLLYIWLHFSGIHPMCRNHTSCMCKQHICRNSLGVG